MSYTWRTHSSGALIVRDGAGPEFLPIVTGSEAECVEAGIARFGELFRVEADTAGIFWLHLVAMAYQESRYNPRAFRQERHNDGTAIVVDGRPLTGCGIFQITSNGLKGNHSDEQLFDAPLNTRLAATYIRDFCKQFKLTRADFPEIAATFNAGSPHAPYKGFENPWNLHCTKGHIDGEVRALNYAATRGMTVEEKAEMFRPDAVVATLIPLTPIARDADDAARHDTEPSPPPDDVA